jgi:hypothetical protein
MHVLEISGLIEEGMWVDMPTQTPRYERIAIRVACMVGNHIGSYYFSLPSLFVIESIFTESTYANV